MGQFQIAPNGSFGGMKVLQPQGINNGGYSYEFNASSKSGDYDPINGSSFYAKGVIPTAPTAPDISELTAQYGFAPRLANTGKLGKAIDSQITNTRASSAQQAANAARAYSARLMQMGISPLASGVVEGQVRTAGNREVADLTVKKEELQQQARKDAAMMAANLSQAIAGIRNDYSKTLADYNLRNATMQQQNNQFNAGLGLDAAKANMAAQQAAAELAAKLSMQGSGSGGGGGRGGGGPGGGLPVGADPHTFSPGYIPSWGPIQPGTGYAGANGHNVMVGWM